ncbi:MAG: glycosyltransferase family 2 protein [Chitinophagales bacterium]
MSAPEISIVLVNYKTPQLLLQCLKSLFAYTKGCLFEVIVVDNGSEDNSEEIIAAEFAGKIQWINMGYNAGFARGNNKGVAAAKAPYVLLLNSDVLLDEDAVTSALHEFKTQQTQGNTGILCCKIVSFEGKVLPGVHSRFPSIRDLLRSNALIIFLLRGKVSQHVHPQQWYNTSHEAAHISGAFMLFNRAQIESTTGLLDEDFFLYLEDVEWCYRLNRAGLSCYYFATTKVMHKDSGSSVNSDWKELQIFISRLLFFYKSYGAFYLKCYVAMYRFNAMLDDFFYRRKGHGYTAAETRAAQWRTASLKAINKYVPLILDNYKRTPHSAKSFLKYEY